MLVKNSSLQLIARSLEYVNHVWEKRFERKAISLELIVLLNAFIDF